MAAKNPRRVKAARAPPKPLEPPEAPQADTWLRSILTDREGNFDIGAVVTVVVCIFMCAASGFDVIHNGRAFDAMGFGTGMGAALGGLAFYRWGDTRRPPQRFGNGPGVGAPVRYDGRGAALDDKWE